MKSRAKSTLPTDRYYRAGPMYITKNQERYAYPARSILSFYSRGISGRWDNLLFWTRDRLVDWQTRLEMKDINFAWALEQIAKSGKFGTMKL
jgi:hypothetical protein